MAWKPDGYTSVAPYLVVDGAQRTIDFLTVVFDAQPLRMHPMGERLGHAEVRIDDTVLMLADGMDGWPPVASHVHLYVPDVDATWSRALGGRPAGPLRGMRNSSQIESSSSSADCRTAALSTPAKMAPMTTFELFTIGW